MKHYVPVSYTVDRDSYNHPLVSEIGIMKTGQFMCLGTLQHLRYRFGNGYAIQIKVAGDDIEKVKQDLSVNIPGIEYHGKRRISLSSLHLTLLIV